MTVFISDSMFYNSVSHVKIICQLLPNIQRSLGLSSSLGKQKNVRVIVLYWSHPSLLQYLLRLSVSLISCQIRGLAWACGVLRWSISALLIQVACLMHSARLATQNHQHPSRDQIRPCEGKEGKEDAGCVTITSFQVRHIVPFLACPLLILRDVYNPCLTWKCDIIARWKSYLNERNRWLKDEREQILGLCFITSDSER